MKSRKLYRLSLLLAGTCVCFPGLQGQSAQLHPPVQFVSTGNALKIANAQDLQTIEGAKTFVQSMAQRGIDFLGDENLTQKEKEKKFRNLLQESFALDTIARFSLGRYWRVSTQAQKEEYRELFRHMIIKVYSRRFSEYSGQDLNVTGARAINETDIIVNSHVVQQNDPNIKIDWRVRYKDGQYNIIDVIIEGVSMAVTQRSDFASVIQRGGGNVDVLLQHLRK